MLPLSSVLFLLFFSAHLASSFTYNRPIQYRRALERHVLGASSVEEKELDKTCQNHKQEFLRSLDRPYELNSVTSQRAHLLKQLIENKYTVPIQDFFSSSPPSSSSSKSIQNPGLSSSFIPVATGTWRVVYAPHMTTIGKLAGNELNGFRVEYNMFDEDDTKTGKKVMTSHAKCCFPKLMLDCCYLSVSGTFGEVNENVCRVDFDRTWVRDYSGDEYDDGPYRRFQNVPEGLMKGLVNVIGNTFFIDAVSVFPISFLDEDLIVFDFELLGTRIVARKMKEKDE